MRIHVHLQLKSNVFSFTHAFLLPKNVYFMIQLEGIFGLKLKQLTSTGIHRNAFTDISLIYFKIMLPIKVVYLKSIIIVFFLSYSAHLKFAADGNNYQKYLHYA